MTRRSVAAPRADAPSKETPVTVADIMTREFEVVHEDATLLEAMGHLRDCPLVEDEIGIKCVVVLDSGDSLAGVLTQSDVVGEILFPYFVRDLADRTAGQRRIRTEDYRALAAWAAKVRVRDVMTRGPVTLAPGDDLFEAADRIVSRKVKSLPVIEGGKVVGIVYRSSLYRHIAGSILESGPRSPS
ncbi:MAG TPA: CBS domain-containing protein [Planctomycetota bacterium]|nr:CBS domain-containing protein [Planctomycetota bacterium]